MTGSCFFSFHRRKKKNLTQDRTGHTRYILVFDLIYHVTEVSENSSYNDYCLSLCLFLSLSQLFNEATTIDINT